MICQCDLVFAHLQEAGILGKGHEPHTTDPGKRYVDGFGSDTTISSLAPRAEISGRRGFNSFRRNRSEHFSGVIFAQIPEKVVAQIPEIPDRGVRPEKVPVPLVPRRGVRLHVVGEVVPHAEGSPGRAGLACPRCRLTLVPRILLKRQHPAAPGEDGVFGETPSPD